MRLSDLMDALPGRPAAAAGELEIGSIHYRSQDVLPGGLFVAISGLRADGHDYVEDALERGAAAVVVQKPVRAKGLVVKVDDSRRALAQLACRFYGDPSEHLHITGVTGTNGKTTTSYLVESILRAAGRRVGVIGTVNMRYDGKSFDNPVTTPESLDLQRTLAQMRQAGVEHVVMEVSSHALDLHRVEGCWLDVGVFTNLTRDHLDYHPDMDHYWACKQKMFTENLGRGPKAARSVAVINRNDPRGRMLFGETSVRAVGVGRGPENDVYPLQAAHDLSGIRASLAVPGGRLDIQSSLVGGYNLENILCAVGAAVAMDLSPDTVRSGVAALTAVPGRLEAVPNASGRFVYVDYAHTPDALQNVLETLAPMAAGGRLICIFGCGGDRDRGKRPKMGDIAGRYCDLVLVTSDNPRGEAPEDIIAQIVPGVSRRLPQAYAAANLADGFSQKGHAVEADRRTAIRLGIAASRPGDIVLIAGKGHETYQLIGGRRIDFDDRLEAAAALAAVQAAPSEGDGRGSRSTA